MKTKLKEKGNKYEHNYILGYFPKENISDEKEEKNEIQNVTLLKINSLLNVRINYLYKQRNYKNLDIYIFIHIQYLIMIKENYRLHYILLKNIHPLK